MREEKEERGQRSNFLTVPYHLKNLNLTKRIVKKNKKHLATKRNLTLFHALRNEKDPLEQKERRGVCRIPVKDVQKNEETVYVGVTSRTIDKWLEEHKKDIEQAKLTTSLAIEAYNKNINIRWDDVKQIRPILDNTQLVVMDTLEILKRTGKERLINDRVNWEPPLAWKYVLMKI